MKNDSISLINNKFTKYISVYDRGVSYGDGFFETMKWRVSNDNLPKVEFWNRHISRITKSCKVAKINIPDLTTLNNYKSKILKRAKKNNFKNGILKIIITRGSGGRGYRFEKNMQPTVIFLSFPYKPYPSSFYRNGIKLEICNNFLSKNFFLKGLKHLNRIDSVLLTDEIDNKGNFEGVVIDENDNVIEGMMSNIFFIKKKILYTPKINFFGIEGIMRQIILEKFSNLFDQIIVEPINKRKLANFDNVFISNSIMGVIPVNKIEKNNYRVSSLMTRINNELKNENFLELN